MNYCTKLYLFDLCAELPLHKHPRGSGQYCPVALQNLAKRHFDKLYKKYYRNIGCNPALLRVGVL